MAASASALTGGNDSVQSPNTTPTASPSRLAGMPPGGDQPPAQGPDQGLQQLTQQLGDMLSTVMDIAGQFPAAASSLRQAEQGLRAAMRAIITSPGSPEPAAPQIGG